MPRDLLDLCYYRGDPAAVAQRLLGAVLVSRIGGVRCSGRIVETEAYLSAGDSASHSARGPTPSNQSMFFSPGTAYVYPIHGNFCFNVVTEGVGIGSAVLIRAIEPVEGLAAMRRRRARAELGQLTSGPGKLCQALGIDRSCDGMNLLRRRRVWIEVPGSCGPARAASDGLQGEVVEPIHVGPRIGVTSAKELELRFFLRGNVHVSRPRR